MRLLLLSLIAATAACVAPVSAAGKPNIIFVLVDDMGYSDLSCYGGKSPTPAIDRLAKEGIAFDRYYVNSPICSPSRTAFLTGQYPQRWRITSFLENRANNAKRGMAQWLDVKAPVLTRQLKAAGYTTGHFGKWHMGGQRDVGEAPLIAEYGFDQSLTNFEGLGPRVLPRLDAFDGKPAREYDLGSAKLGRGQIRWEDRSAVTSVYVKESLDFIGRAQADGKPFYLHLWPDDVHSPFFPPQVLRKDARGEKRALYQAVVQAMDRQLAALFERIRSDAALRDNTLIVLSSDNGPEPGAGSAGPLRGHKGALYEGGIREPLIVWGPGFIASEKAGTRHRGGALSSIDLTRSLYAFTGMNTPDGTVPDGENLIDTLLGKSDQGRKAPLFWRRPPDRPGPAGNPFPDLAVLDASWKCYTRYDGKGTSLYDLASDEAETKDVASQHPDIAEGLTRKMMEWNAALPPDAGDPAFKP
jgi:uncharacterized sulfatase